MRLHDFATALLDPARPVPPGLIGPDGKPSARRFNVYRNNVVAGLTRVLREGFPATARLVGDEFFAATAREYAMGEPPDTPMLFDYGKGFPDFLERFAPVAHLPYLPDVARIERAWVEAYHAPEACALHPSAFARLGPRDSASHATDPAPVVAPDPVAFPRAQHLEHQRSPTAVRNAESGCAG